MEQKTTNTRPVHQGINFSTACYPPQEFDKSVFIDCTFDDLELSFMNMRAALFINCSFKRTNLTASNLTCAELRDCDMTDANLTAAVLCDADLLTTDFDNVGDIRGADFLRARLPYGMYNVNVRTADDTYITALFTSSWMAVNDQSATVHAWREVIDSHTGHTATKFEVHRLLAMADALGEHQE